LPSDNNRLLTDAADRKQAIIAIVKGREKVTTPNICELIGLSDGRVRTLLREMVADGTIEKIGDNRYTYYVLKS